MLGILFIFYNKKYECMMGFIDQHINVVTKETQIINNNSLKKFKSPRWR